MCINADESEPGTFNNRILMEEDPHQVLEGIILSCYATRAQTAYIYLRYEYPLSYRSAAGGDRRVLRRPATWARTSWASDFSLDIYLHRGAAAYICGEETGLIESLEGKRAWPRIKPPFPAVEGVFRKPTVVNNIETARLRHPHRRSRRRLVQIDRRAGRSQEPARSGQLWAQALLPQRPREQAGLLRSCRWGLPAAQLIDEYGGGVWKGRKAKAAIPGGISMGLLTESRVRHAARFRRAWQASAAWGWAPRPSW